MERWLMIMEQLVEWELVEETEVLANLLGRSYVICQII
jgi:hypothetical protein